MNLNEYQRISIGTYGWHGLSYLGLGLTGESGEVAEIIKKTEYHGHPLSRNAISKELGDVLWYVSVMASELGISLDDLAIENIEKLQGRYPDGFSKERSVNRNE